MSTRRSASRPTPRHNRPVSQERAHELAFPRDFPGMEYDVWARSVIWQAERWLRHHMAAHNVPTPRTLHEVQELRAILHSIAAAELHRDLHEDEDRLLNELLDHRLANIATALGRLQPEIPSFLLDEGRN